MAELATRTEFLVVPPGWQPGDPAPNPHPTIERAQSEALAYGTRCPAAPPRQILRTVRTYTLIEGGGL